MSEGVSVLCTGDIHLGRHPTRIPSDLDGPGFSPKTVWQDIVDEALDRGVTLVAITGDVIDRANRYFEAYGAFEDGARRLDDAGIPVVVVAGNHDFDVLPRLIEEVDLDQVHLLGADGQWERWTFERDDASDIHIDGWSFPTEHVYESPLDSNDLDAPDAGHHLGLLHADLDVADSEYAPVERPALEATNLDGWLLGHIHSPSTPRESDPLILYPGSPQPLDPGETGTHGPWLLSISDGGMIDSTHLPLATVRYDGYEVDITDADDIQAVPGPVADRIRSDIADSMDTGALEVLLARVTVTGRSSIHGTLVDSQGLLEEQMEFREGSLPVRIERLDVATRPAADLDELASSDSPVGYLAQIIQTIEEGEVLEEYPDLVREVLDTMQTAHRSRAYTLLSREGTVEPPARDDAVDRLDRQARLLLDELRSQKQEAE